MARSLFVPQVMPSGEAIQPQRIAVNPDMFGAGIGEAIQGLGASVSRFGAEIEANKKKMQLEADTAAANEAYIGAAIGLGQAEAEFVTTSGSAAASGYSNYVANIQKIRDKAKESLNTPEAKFLFDREFRARMLSSIDTGSTHAAREHKAYVTNQAQGRLDLAVKDSATKFNDENLFQSNLSNIAKLVAEQAKIGGWSPEEAASKWIEYRSKAWSQRITAFANADPLGARQMFAAQQDNMTPDEAITVNNTINERLRTTGVKNLTKGAFSNPAIMADSGFVSAIAGGGDLGGLSPAASTMLEGIRRGSGIPTLNIVSGYRSAGRNAAAGGAKHSQHIGGNALDISLVGLTDAQKASVLQAAIASGARGIGIYRSGNSLHVDTRANPALWGMGADSYKGHGPELAPAWAQPALAELFSGRYGGRGVLPGGSFVNRIIEAETSGGRNIRVSSSGALGIMQVLPDTARMVSAQLGIPFSAQRLHTDHAYNMLIGTTYLNMQLKRYGGNETLAAAAYNAGPGRVDQWIAQFGDPRTGAISNEAWAAKIPIDETRNYVSKVMTGRGAPPPQRLTAVTDASGYKAVQDYYAAQAEFYAPGDTVYAAAVRADIEGQYNDMKKVLAEAEAANYDTALKAALGDGVNGPTDLNALLDSDEAVKAAYYALGPEKQQSIIKQLQANSAERTTPTDEDLAEFQRLRGMALTDPVAFAKENIAEKDNLTQALKKELIELQTRKPTAEDEKKLLNLTDALKIAQIPLAAAGITEDDDSFNTFVGAFSIELNRYLDENKKSPTDEEVRKIVSGLLTKTGGTGSWPYILSGPPERFLFEGTQEEIQRALRFESNFEAVPELEVPASDRRQIIDAWTRKNGTAPNESQINMLYRQRLLLSRGKK